MANKPPVLSRCDSRSVAIAMWACRACFAVVFAWNMVCTWQFILWPENYMGSFGLEGSAGKVAVAGMGVAFLMWNVTFPAFIISPRRFRCLGVAAIVQQVIGVVGETWILCTLAQGEPAAAAIVEFLHFDVAGLILMAVSFVWICVALRGATKLAA